MRKMTPLFVMLITVLHALALNADDKVLKIYHDADRSVHGVSAISIERGIKTALSEVNNEKQGYKIEFVAQDHRGNVLRSKRNYSKFIVDPQALVMFSGIHSPPLIVNRDYINKNRALTLVPWAAGGSITRHPGPDNWIFRLSIDDMRAGQTIVDAAVDTYSCKSPALLLESTPWGDSNLQSMSEALNKRGIAPNQILRFGMNLKEVGANVLVRKVQQASGDCIILVANAKEAASIAKAMAKMPNEVRIPLISHWGITAGEFHVNVKIKDRQKLDLAFIQTCFAFTTDPLPPFAAAVFARAKALYPGEIESVGDIKSPAGFIHAYDLTRLLLAAIDQTKITGNKQRDQFAIKRALEDLQKPVQGLVKRYTKPFSPSDGQNLNAHEALGNEQYCMASYGRRNEIIVQMNK